MTEIETHINNDINPFDINEKIGIIKDFFIKYNFSHFPVIEQEIYLGCINAENAKTFDYEKTIADYIYTLEYFYIRDTTSWLDIQQAFVRNHAGIIPVLSSDDKYIGYYEIINIIERFNETPFIKERGDIIIIEKETNEYTISQIAQIIESNNTRLLGLYISNISPEKTQITLKINLDNISEIIQTFRKFNYEIISEHVEDSYIENLKDRSDYLNKYLNI